MKKIVVIAFLLIVAGMSFFIFVLDASTTYYIKENYYGKDASGACDYFVKNFKNTENYEVWLSICETDGSIPYKSSVSSMTRPSSSFKAAFSFLSLFNSSQDGADVAPLDNQR